MEGRTSTFNQRIVKVVAPTVEAKRSWAEEAAKDGFQDNVSGWLKNLIAHHRGQELRTLKAEARTAEELARRVKELEAENRVLNNAYEKVNADLARVTAQYDEVLNLGGAQMMEIASLKMFLEALAEGLRKSPRKRVRTDAKGNIVVSQADIDELLRRTERIIHPSPRSGTTARAQKAGE